MTKREFFDGRAKADYLKTHAVTKVAPVVGEADWLTVRPMRNRAGKIGRIVREMTEPSQQPITKRVGVDCGARRSWEKADIVDAFARNKRDR